MSDLFNFRHSARLPSVFPTILLSLRDTPNKLPDLQLRVHGTGAVEPAPQFSIETFDEIAAAQQDPKIFRFVEEADVIIEPASDQLDGFWVSLAPTSLQITQSEQGLLAAGSPKGSMHIDEETLPIRGRDASLDVAHQVYDAELVGGAQQVRDGGLDALVLVGYDHSQRLTVESACEHVFDQGRPAILALPITQDIAQDVTTILAIDTKGEQQGLVRGEARTADREVKRIQEH